MREIGFSKKWAKLEQTQFSTFRFTRRDKRDWQVEEVVRVVYKPRTKQREVLGIARIIRKEPKNIKNRWSYCLLPRYPNTPDMITPWEAEEDGFTGMHGGGDTEKMRRFFLDTYGYSKCNKEPINKLTLRWIEKEAKS